MYNNKKVCVPVDFKAYTSSPELVKKPLKHHSLYGC